MHTSYMHTIMIFHVYSHYVTYIYQAIEDSGGGPLLSERVLGGINYKLPTNHDIFAKFKVLVWTLFGEMTKISPF